MKFYFTNLYMFTCEVNQYICTVNVLIINVILYENNKLLFMKQLTDFINVQRIGVTCTFCQVVLSSAPTTVGKGGVGGRV